MLASGNAARVLAVREPVLQIKVVLPSNVDGSEGKLCSKGTIVSDSVEEASRAMVTVKVDYFVRTQRIVMRCKGVIKSTRVFFTNCVKGLKRLVVIAVFKVDYDLRDTDEHDLKRWV